jgi:hypothetical protein
VERDGFEPEICIAVLPIVRGSQTALSSGLRAATSQVQKTPCAVGSGATLKRARMAAPRRVTGSNPLRSTRKSTQAAVGSVFQESLVPSFKGRVVCPESGHPCESGSERRSAHRAIDLRSYGRINSRCRLTTGSGASLKAHQRQSDGKAHQVPANMTPPAHHDIADRAVTVCDNRHSYNPPAGGL